MVGDNPVSAVLISADLDACRDFYEKKLGLELSPRTIKNHLHFGCGDGTTLLIYFRPGDNNADHTEVRFWTQDIEADVGRAPRSNRPGPGCSRRRLLRRVNRPGEGFHPIGPLSRPRRRPPRCLHHLVGHPAEEEGICLSEVLGRVTMQVFVRGDFTVLAATVQCDVDGISEGSHCVISTTDRTPPFAREQAPA
jgi:catechol 2,3-dioxygenase-like lactoylglutathione lyase family enzyme